MEKENPNPSQTKAYSILQPYDETFSFKLELKHRNLNITYYNLVSCMCMYVYTYFTRVQFRYPCLFTIVQELEAKNMA